MPNGFAPSKAPPDNATLFLIGGLADVDLATNQSLKNAIKFLSEFGHRIHFFGAFPANYRILQDPKKIFNGRVFFHRSPHFLTPLFDFAKLLKNTFGMSKKKEQRINRLRAAQKIQYHDEYNLLGRLFFIYFFFVYALIEAFRISYYYFKFKPDLFYGIGGPGSALATLFGRLFGKPAVQRWHGAIGYTAEDVQRIKTRLFDKFLTLDGAFAKLLPSDAVILTDDGSWGDKLFRQVGVPPEKIHLWRNGLDLEDMTLPPDWNPEAFKKSLGLQDRKILIMVSRLVLWKRLDRGIEGLFRLVKKYNLRDVTLLILGDGQARGELEALTQELGVGDCVRFLGPIPHDQVVQYYSIADVFMSLYDLSNLGNPLLEAMYCGLPIVSVDDGSTAELLQDAYNAFLVPHERLEEDLPLKLEMLLTDASLRAAMGANARKTFGEKVLSWKDRMLLEDELIRKLLSSQKQKEIPAAQHVSR